MWKWALLTGFLLGMRMWLEAEARAEMRRGES